jgi:hypothetical protein
MINKETNEIENHIFGVLFHFYLSMEGNDYFYLGKVY